MSLENLFIYFSAISFIVYSLNSIYSKRLIFEFERWGYSKHRLTIAYLQLLASIGLIIGLYVPLILTVVSFALFLMMIFAIFVRVKIKDTFLEILPAIFYAIINFIIFCNSLF